MTENTQPEEQGLTRRSSLVRLGGLFLGALSLGGWRAGSSRSTLAAPAGSGPAAVASGAVSCVLTPELTEGPFYVPNERVRRNIAEGRPGAPLLLRLAVVDASTCRPIRNAAVDVWHCDAVGVYSGVQGNHQHLMRGVQRTDRNGIARFPHRVPRLVPGPRRSHPREGAHLGQRRAHRPAVLPGRDDRRRLPPRGVPRPRRARHPQRRRRDLPQRRPQVDARDS